MAWNDGYVTDVNYTFGYYNELNPVRIQQALNAVSHRSPEIKNACELGFGQGISTLIHAAAQPGVQWWGTDFNPSQAGYAQELAKDSGSSANLFDQAFDEFCGRDDLPQFDFIALHGIWTWISDNNRKVVVDFIRRKLSVGGVLYISYNTLPGWAPPAPLRHLMNQYDRAMAAPGVARSERVGEALDFLDRLILSDPSYVRTYPHVAERARGLREQDRNYLAHEYLNDHWDPIYFSQMAEWLEPAKVSFVSSVNLLEQQDPVNLTPVQITLINGISDAVFRQTVRDFMIGQQFRRDLWIRGPRQLTPLEQAEKNRSQRYLLMKPRSEVELKAKGMQGEATLHPEVYEPLLDALAGNEIKPFPELELAGLRAGLAFSQIASALVVLTGIGAITAVQDEKMIAKARPSTQKLNRALFEQARSRNDVGFLASPVTGGGVPVARIEQIFLWARAEGRKTPADWAAFAYDIFAAQGQNLIKDGRALITPEENVAELTVQAEAFNSKAIPILKALGIA